MMDFSTFAMFAFASLMLNLTPGVDMIYVATRSTTQGIYAGLISALGIMIGCSFHILATVAGLSLLLTQSAVAFNLIKYLGAIYLIYLGIKSLWAKNQDFSRLDGLSEISFRQIFWQGVITNILNPKVAIFFLAFLPQFVNYQSINIHWQILFLGVWFNFSGTIVNILVAILFGKLGNFLSQNPAFVSFQDKFTAGILILLGIRMLFLEKK